METKLKKLEKKFEGLTLYDAGLPGFPRNFSRDSIIAAILSKNMKMLKDQLIFSAMKQGKNRNAYYGEEPGKIHHEHPGVEIDGLSTEYNACDTTALFLIGHEIYLKLTKDTNLVNSQLKNINNAVSYILSHIKNNIFYESPEFAGAKRFALKVTYWKDSQIYGREKGEPVYPVSYMLAHIQNMRALKSAAFLLKDDKHLKKADEMYNSFLNNFYDVKVHDKPRTLVRGHFEHVKNRRFLSAPKNSIARILGVQKVQNKSQGLFDEKGIFYIAIDKKGKIEAVSSDILHMLFYLDNGQLNEKMKKTIGIIAKKLGTRAGYRTLSFNDAKKISDNYHSETIWPFEQAIIHNGAYKFKFNKLMEVSKRIRKFIDEPYELMFERDNFIEKGGNSLQLWTIATQEYFERYADKPFSLFDKEN